MDLTDIKKSIHQQIKNGYYIPFLYLFLLYIFRDMFHVTLFIIKLHSVNHFYWFGELYNYRNIPKQFNFVKQFVRMTDTGHLVSLLYMIDPSFLPLAHNVHFFITAGFWTGKYLGSQDQDMISNRDMISISNKEDQNMILYDNTISCISHGVPYILFLRELWITDQCHVFDLHTLWISYQWNYIWLFMVYLPWRIYTGDVIYTILDMKEGIKKPLKFFCFLHVVTLVSNIIGYGMSYMVCNYTQ